MEKASEAESQKTATHSGAATRAPKLLDRVRDAIRARHYSRRTEEAYVHWIRRYIVFDGKRHPNKLGAVEVTAFLLAVRRHVAVSTQNQVFRSYVPAQRSAATGSWGSSLPILVRSDQYTYQSC